MNGGEEITPDLLRSRHLPAPEPDGDKDDRGRVLVVGGDEGLVGAVLLAGVAALRSGAGKLQLATAAVAAPHLAMAAPEALVTALPQTPSGSIAPQAAETLSTLFGRCDTALIGPGTMDQDAAGELAARLLGQACKAAIVLDAAALTGLANRKALVSARVGPVVITPHAGEMASLMDVGIDQVKVDPLAIARRAAQSLQAIVVMKGARSLVVAPDGRWLSHSQGIVGLATSGSGDVLAGALAGLLARGAGAFEAAAWAVYIHGRAGRRVADRVGPLGFLAREVADELPRVLMEVEGREV